MALMLGAGVCIVVVAVVVVVVRGVVGGVTQTPVPAVVWLQPTAASHTPVEKRNTTTMPLRLPCLTGYTEPITQ